MKLQNKLLSAIAISMLSMPIPLAAADGKVLSAPCLGCHSLDGSKRGNAVSLQGLSSAAIQQSMLDFKSGARSGTVMPAIAKQQSDENIKSIADYIDSIN